jgi:hypothetical protein
MTHYVPNHPINKKSCIGDSLQTINASFSSLDTNLYTLSSYVYRDLNGYALLKIGNLVKRFEATADTNVARMDALKKALQYAQLTPSISAVVELSQGNFGIPSGFPLSTYASNTNIEFNEGSAVIYANPEDATSDSGFYEGPRNVLNFGALPTFDDFNAGATAVDCLPALKAAYNSLPISPGSYDPITGRGAGETPPPNKGNGTEYTTTAAGFAVSATSIPIIAGTGDVLVNDIITFNGDGNQYTVTGGVSASGTIFIASPGLKQAIPPTATKMYIKGMGTPIRIGIIYFPQSSAKQSAIYYISDTWYISAFTNLIGENKYIYINFKNNVATVSEKFVVYMLSNESNGPGAANTFNAHIDNLVISGNRQYNAYSSGLRFSCAQRGVIGWLTITECSLRGYVTDINGGSIDIGYLSAEAITRGPGVSVYTSYSFSANQVVCSFINNNLWAKDSDGDYYPAFYAENVKGININAFQAEDACNGVKLKRCNGVYIPILSTSKYLKNITNATNASPIVITSAGHGRSTGDKVTITGITGNTNANVTNVAISAIDIDTFALTGISGNGTFGGTAYYLPGNNAGVVCPYSDNYEFGLDVNYAAYVLRDTTTGVALAGNLLSDAKGKYSKVPRLDDRLSFVYGGTVESRTANMSIAATAPGGIVGIFAGTSYTQFFNYNMVGTSDSFLQLTAPAGGNCYIEGAGASDSLCVGTAGDKPIYLRPNRTTTVTLSSNSIRLALTTLPTTDPGPGKPGTLWRSGSDLKITLT